MPRKAYENTLATQATLLSIQYVVIPNSYKEIDRTNCFWAMLHLLSRRNMRHGEPARPERRKLTPFAQSTHFDKKGLLHLQDSNTYNHTNISRQKRDVISDLAAL